MVCVILRDTNPDQTGVLYTQSGDITVYRNHTPEIAGTASLYADRHYGHDGTIENGGVYSVAGVEFRIGRIANKCKQKPRVFPKFRCIRSLRPLVRSLL